MPTDTTPAEVGLTEVGLAEVERAVRAQSLTVSCGLDEDRCADSSDLPPGTRTLLLLSPLVPGFWTAFTDSPEWHDGAPDPMDRWSLRVIGALARTLDATPLFPFGGPPFAPFLRWAQDSDRAHGAPVGMLVSPEMGLFTSYRGALAFPHALKVPAAAPSPCTGCAAPCLTACPVGALGGPGGYDVPACKTHLSTPGNDCLTTGCLVRRSCPAGAGHVRLPGHSAYHMQQFLGTP